MELARRSDEDPRRTGAAREARPKRPRRRPLGAPGCGKIVRAAARVARAGPPATIAEAAAAGCRACRRRRRSETRSREFIWPAKGKVLAGFAEPRSQGHRHRRQARRPGLAAAAGRVTYTGNGIPGLGKLVVIKHDNGFITVYAHNRDILVKEQQTVARGQKIAELGSSDADRPKLHFQIRKGSAAVDPLRYLPAL